MKTRVRIALGASVLVALALLGASAEAIRRATLPATLTEVRTVSDLRDTRPIRVAKNTRAWLGVSSTTVGVGEALIIYALVEGEHERPTTAKGLGPFEVRVKRHALEAMKQLRALPDSKEPQLYLRAVTFDEPGVEEVQLILAGSIVAVERVTVSETRPRLPSFLRLRNMKDRLRDRHCEHGWCEGRCAVVRGTLTSIDLEGDWVVGAYATGRLPRLFESVELHVAPEGDELVVQSSRPDLEGGPTALKWAARWWVNGRPVVRHELEEFAYSGKWLHESKRVERIHLHADLETIGARPGDRIEVQLLENSGPLPRLTNRVTLPAP